MRSLAAFAWQTPQHFVRLGILQRMSDARTQSSQKCGAALWRNGSCWMGADWQAVGLTGLRAIDDFNARRGTFVPAFASVAKGAAFD